MWRPYAFVVAWTLVSLVILGGVALFSWPVPLGDVGPSANACLNNLHQIDGAKEQWALENKKSQGNLPDLEKTNEYMKGGAPKCPAGGYYSYNPVGTPPTCTQSSVDNFGHALLSREEWRVLQRQARRSANLRLWPGVWCGVMAFGLPLAALIRHRALIRGRTITSPK